MGKYVGVDWAGRGWFGVVFEDDGSVDADLFPSIWSCWKYHSDADRILVDVPIGLPSRTSGRRRCDVEAKRVLGRRHRSVFYAPIREAVYETNLQHAKDINEAAGFSIQNQAWSIVPRIRELDEFLDMNRNAVDRIAETHPEVCFRTLADAPLAHPKTTRDGVDERLAILTDEHVDAEELFVAFEDEFRTPAYAPTVPGRDDVLDAMVAALVARRPEGELSRLPRSPPPTDARDLPMQIVHPARGQQVTLDAIE